MTIPKTLTKKVTKNRPLTLEDHVAILKANEIDVSEPAIECEKLKKLRNIRNAIAHQGGMVTDENVDRLKDQGYKVGDWVRVDDKYFRDAVGLVIESSQKITELCMPVFTQHRAAIGQSRSIQ